MFVRLSVGSCLTLVLPPCPLASSTGWNGAFGLKIIFFTLKKKVRKQAFVCLWGGGGVGEEYKYIRIYIYLIYILWIHKNIWKNSNKNYSYWFIFHIFSIKTVNIYFIENNMNTISLVFAFLVSLCSFLASFSDSDRRSRAQFSKACDIFLSRLRRKSAHLIFPCPGWHLLFTFIRRVYGTGSFFKPCKFSLWFDTSCGLVLLYFLLPLRHIIESYVWHFMCGAWLGFTHS